MDTGIFIGIPTQELKIKKLKEMTDTEKETLVNNQKQKILKNWDSCELETNDRLNSKFENIDNEILYFDQLLSFSDWTYRKYNYKFRNPKHLFQWDIFYCDLGHNIQSEKNKLRPVLILQKTRGYLDARTITIAPITIGENFADTYKHEVLIDKTKYGNIKGKIDLSHIRSVDKSRLNENPADRLLKKDEYINNYGEGYETVQTKVGKSLVKFFGVT